MSEVLAAIGRAGSDPQPVFELAVADAGRLCGATGGSLWLRDGDVFRIRAGWSADGETNEVYMDYSRQHPPTLNAAGIVGRVFRAGAPLQIPDVMVDPDYPKEQLTYLISSMRTLLGVPLLHAGKIVGVISLVRATVKPFTEHEIAVVRTFAEQAVLALENARLLMETSAALDRQTATSEVLKAISDSAFDLQPMFDKMLRTAARICRADYGYLYHIWDGRDLSSIRMVASLNVPDDEVQRNREVVDSANQAVRAAHVDRGPLNADSFRESAQSFDRTVGVDRRFLANRVWLAGATVHVPEIADDPDFALNPAYQRLSVRALLGVPMRRGNDIGGCITLTKTTPGPFDESAIELVETFADQAMIAIENVRLFNETKEALARQTATSEVLQSISRTVFDLDAVLTTVLENAMRLCNSSFAGFYRREGDVFPLSVSLGGSAEWEREVRAHPPDIHGGGVTARATLQKRPVQIHDVLADPEFEYKDQARIGGQRTLLGVPLLRDDEVVGVLSLARREVSDFSLSEIELVQTFADQAAIAIENVRLFNQTQDALERQTAMSDVLSEMSQSAFDIGPVLQTVLDRAYRLSEADHGWFIRSVGDRHRLEAYRGDSELMQSVLREGSGDIIPRGWTKQAITERRTQRVDDLTDEYTRFPLTMEEIDRLKQHFRSHPEERNDPKNAGSFAKLTSAQKLLAVPLLRGATALGVIVLTRSSDEQFSDRQIEIVETFAQQAAIAIENVRLFNETKEALARQTATSEVLQVISRSESDLRSVFEIAVEKAVTLCHADHGWIIRIDPDGLGRYEAYRGPNQEMQRQVATGEFLSPASADATHSVCRRAELERRIVHVPDVEQEPEVLGPRLRAIGAKSIVALPLLGPDRVVGVFVLARSEKRPFTGSEIELVKTFADQAVIAIENARLLSEIQGKSRQLEAVNRELAAASRHKSEFLANMSHELRTPLNAIIGFSDVLEQRLFGELNDRQADYARDIASSGRHLLDLVNEILDLSKVEAGRMELEVSEFALAETIRGALAYVRERAARQAIEIAADIPTDLGTLLADERKVRQVLLNLLSNAVKFTPDGGTITVQAHRGDGEVQVSVRDTGIGIAPEDQAKVFDEFQQVGKATDRSREGTGLGLTLAKRFIELHGGRIWIDSEVGRGTSFTFAIPVGRVAPAPA